MKIKKSFLKTPIALIIIAIHMLPVYVTLVTALTNITDFKSYVQWPSKPYLGNFVEAFTYGKMGIAFRNTMIITVFAVILIVLLGSFAAYPLARNPSKTNKLIGFIIISLMMIPPLSLLVPLYPVMKSINAIDTHWGIILLHTAYQLPMSVFLFKNFITAIPKELDEAAVIDGCNVFQIFSHIILPNIKPVIVTVIILTGVSVWNDFQFSQYFLQSNNMRVVTQSISSFFAQGDVNLNVAAGAAILGIIPITLLYLFLQKYFVQGMVDSAIK